MPISFRSAFAAGAAAAAAQQAGRTEHQQVQQAELAGRLVDEVDAKQAGEQSAGPSAEDTLEAMAARREAREQAGEPPPHHAPTQPPGPGFISHLARWLKLK